ncbi:MAG: c-type cytochrome biogenesis protein CcmI [Rhodospirillales bacterium]
MTGLWIVLALMTAAVLAVLLAPLIRGTGKKGPARSEYDLAVFKDQLAELDRDRERGLLGDGEAEAARIEIQRRMLAAAGPGADETEAPAPLKWPVAAAIGAAVTTAAFGFYFILGSPSAPNQPFAERNIASEISAREGRLNRDEVLGLTAKLEQRLKENPGDLNSWMLLGRTYLTINETGKAVAALWQAMEVSKRRPDVVSSYAEALVLAEQGNVPPEARRLFSEILAADSLNSRARYYLGLELAQRGKVKEALQAWVDLRSLSPEGAPWLAPVDQQIASAAQELGLAPWAVKPSAEALALALTRGLKTGPAPSPAAGAPAAGAPPSLPRGPSAADVQSASQMSAADRNQMIRTMVQRLADRLKENPDDRAGWQRLARAYNVLGETEKAEDAKARADALAGKGR